MGANTLTAEQDVFLGKLERIGRSHPRNLCAKHLTRALFASFDAPERGRLQACCRSGAENPDSIVGCYVLRPDDLRAFGAFFDPLIREHHGIPDRAPAGPEGEEDPDQGAALDLARLGLPPSSIRVRVGRNLATYPMPGRMDRGERIRLERFMTQALAVLIDDPAYGGRVFSLTPDFGADGPNPNRIEGPEHRTLVEANIMFASMEADRFMESGGLAADWPYGRACYVSQDRSIIVWIGEEDHLRIISLRNDTRLVEVYARLQSALAIIEAIPGVAFVRDADYGFVTSCPSNLGAGLRVSVRVTLPRLTEPGVDTKAVCRRTGLGACGPAGEHSPIEAGGPIVLSPIRRLFLTDHDVLARLYDGLSRLAGPCDVAEPTRRARQGPEGDAIG